MVNRLWGWMYGRGLVHPVDALDSFHPASHPGLLDWLARDFEHSKYDVRRLLRQLALKPRLPIGLARGGWKRSEVVRIGDCETTDG